MGMGSPASEHHTLSTVHTIHVFQQNVHTIWENPTHLHIYLGFQPTLLRQPSWKTGCKMSQLFWPFATLMSLRGFLLHLTVNQKIFGNKLSAPPVYQCC